MPNKRVVDNYRRDPHNGTQLRNVYTAGGKTHVGTLSLAPTPNGQHDTWLFKFSGEEEARRNENDQSIRDARNKAQREEIAGKRARLSLTHRAQSFSMKLPLVSAPDRAKARNSLSAQVRRAEQPPEDRDAANATRRANDQVGRAEQLPEDRDAVNATRRANDQVTACLCIARPLHTCALGCWEYFPKTQTNDAFIF